MKHPIFEYLVMLVSDSTNHEAKGVPITLSVKGTIISGEIVSKTEFFEAPENAGLKAAKDKMSELSKKHNMEIDDEDINADLFIYLRNASYYSGSQKFPTLENTYILVSLDSVDAFNVGVLSS